MGIHKKQIFECKLLSALIIGVVFIDSVSAMAQRDLEVLYLVQDALIDCDAAVVSLQKLLDDNKPSLAHSFESETKRRNKPTSDLSLIKTGTADVELSSSKTSKTEPRNVKSTPFRSSAVASGNKYNLHEYVDNCLNYTVNPSWWGSNVSDVLYMINGTLEEINKYPIDRIYIKALEDETKQVNYFVELGQNCTELVAASDYENLKWETDETHKSINNTEKIVNDEIEAKKKVRQTNKMVSWLVPLLVFIMFAAFMCVACNSPSGNIKSDGKGSKSAKKLQDAPSSSRGTRTKGTDNMMVVEDE